VDLKIYGCRHLCNVHASSPKVYEAPLSKLLATYFKNIRDAYGNIVEIDVAFDIIIGMKDVSQSTRYLDAFYKLITHLGMSKRLNKWAKVL
jgi:hypothetical protein